MTHDNFDDLFETGVRSYNTPPATPREQMWEAIAHARANRNVIPISSARSIARVVPIRRWFVTAAGIAAVLMVGVMIGRMSRGTVTTVATIQRPLKAKPHTETQTSTTSE